MNRAQRRPLPGWLALRSLRARLFAFGLALGGVAALAVGGATYVSVRAEADQLFDYHLRQMALSLRDQGRIAADESAALANPEFDYVVQIWSMQGLTLYSSRPAGMAEPLPPRAVIGFSLVRLGGEDWRVFATATPLRVVQVAQPVAVRRRLAAAAALRSVAPVAVAAPLVVLGLWALIGVSLAPLQRVARAAQSRHAQSLDALPTEGLPAEVQPLVQSFNALLARLAAAFDAQRGFVADAAHELRTPLTALKLQLGLLAGSPPGPELDAAVQRLRAGVDRAVRLVEQLLALARAEPATVAAVADLDLAQIARAALAEVAPLAERRGVAIDLDAPAPVWLRGDAQALGGAVRNLLDNAVKYGGPTVRLSVALDAGAPLLRVDDAGPGIPVAEREQAFERFRRLGGGGSEGSGLGLAIVRAVARQHGAQALLADSPLGGLRAELRWRAGAPG